MKWFMSLLLVLGAIGAFVYFYSEDPGFIVIGRGAWTVETTLSLFTIALVLGGIIIYLFIRLLLLLWYLPGRLLYSSPAVRQQRAEESLIRGLLALIEGQWKNAEQVLLKSVYGKLSPLHYLGAAYAASQQQAPSRATEYIEKVREDGAFDSGTLTLFEAKLQLSHDLSAALQKAQQAHRLAPKNDEVLLLLLTLYLQLADWQALLELLPEVRKRKRLPTEQLQSLENRAHLAQIRNTMLKNPVQTTKVWSRISKMTRLQPMIVKVYVKHLMAAGDAVTAEPLLREALKYHWDADLVYLYGELETTNTSQQLSYAESWLKRHEQDPILLQTLGHLSMRNRLWSKAQQYLEESVRLTPSPQTYQLLGDLSKQKGEPAQANDYYRRGLQLAIDRK
jgi:HemY protein